MRIRSVGHLRRLFVAWALATSLAVGLAPVVAALSATYAISGIEYAATSTEGKFAGVAVAVAADDFGTWEAAIHHTELSGSPLTAAIDGGTFSYDGKFRDIAGRFSSGSLTQTGGFAPCSNRQTFNVIGSLALTSPAGSGEFTATLTHFQKLIFGRCITYAATVKGTVAFTL